MSYDAKKLLKQGLLTLPLVALLSGCGGLEEKSDSASSSHAGAGGNEMVRVTGGAVKGVIQQGLVTAHRLVPDSHGVYQVERIITRSVRTDNRGKFDLKLRGKASGWALVELKADDRTRMTCDVVPHCDIAGAAPVAFGETFPLDSNFTLRGAVDLSKGSVYLTPLSQLAVGLAERSPTGLSEEALGAAYSNVEGWFGLSAGALALPPPDLTQLDQDTRVSADAIQLAVINAAFLAVVNDDPNWGSITDVLNGMMGQIAATGTLETVGRGDSLSLSDLTATAAIQASELQATVDSSLMSQKLAIVTQRNRKQFETIANGYLDDLDSTDGLADSGRDSDSVADNGSVGGTTGGFDRTSGDSSIAPSTGSGSGSVIGGGSYDPVSDLIAANAARLSWQAPFVRENGDSISMGELAGYEILYGMSPEALDKTLAIGDASIDKVVIDDLSSGNWYFAIRSIDTDGNKSRLSDVVNKTISI